MGGYNSGGGRGAMREGHFWKLDIATLKRLDMLRPGYWRDLVWNQRGQEAARVRVECHDDHLILDYRSRPRGGEWQPIRDHIPLTFTFPNYGGRRAWFVCPSCDRRKRVLWGGTYYRCAGCYDMTYDSQYEDRASRLLDRAQSIRIRLGGTANCTEPFPPRPKGMHFRTYWRCFLDYERLYAAACAATMAKFGLAKPD